MNINDFKKHINSLTSHILFDFNGKECGIDPLSKNKFDVWYGENLQTVQSVHDVMSIPIFDGQSLTQVFDKIDKIDY